MSLTGGLTRLDQVVCQSDKHHYWWLIQASLDSRFGLEFRLKPQKAFWKCKRMWFDSQKAWSTSPWVIFWSKIGFSIELSRNINYVQEWEKNEHNWKCLWQMVGPEVVIDRSNNLHLKLLIPRLVSSRSRSIRSVFKLITFAPLVFRFTYEQDKRSFLSSLSFQYCCRCHNREGGRDDCRYTENGEKYANGILKGPSCWVAFPCRWQSFGVLW